MGTTCSSLHILRPDGSSGDLSKAIGKAYADLGYVSVPRGDAGKNVVVLDDGEGRFVTIVDSDNAEIDTGELKQLGVALSKRLSTVAIVTSILDSDSFELLVFRAGKQIDCVASEPPAPASGLKVLKGKKRLESWLDMLVWADARRLMQKSPLIALDAQAMAALEDRRRDLEARFSRAGSGACAFAEEALSNWCEVMGLEPKQALSPFSVLEGRSGADTLHLHLAKKQDGTASLKAETAVATKAGSPPSLAWLRADDACPYHRFHPAAWPIEPAIEQGCRWLVTSSAGGISGLRLDLDAEPSTAVEIDMIGAAAFPFFNGQITSMTPLASVELRGPWSSRSIDIAPFALPDLDPQSRRQIVIELRLRFRATGREPFSLRPTLVALPAGVTLALPPLSLQAIAPDWHPRVMTSKSSQQAEARLRLNAPSVLSMVAMIDDDGAAARRRVRGLGQGWLATMALPAGAEIEIGTSTHLSTTSFRVSRNSKRYTPEELRSEKLWSRLLEGKTAYQRIALAVHMPDMPHAIAGFDVQAALHGADGGPLAGALLTVSLWALNGPRVLTSLCTTPENLTKLFEAWLEAEAPVQAWVAQAAWIPEFDDYDAFRQTVYEEAADLDWFRSGMNGKLALREWADRHLRFVAPRMWIGPALAERIDRTALQAVADVIAEPGRSLRITLKPGHTLAELEQALSPLLPTAS